MPLPLAGEALCPVQGLDDLGWVRQVLPSADGDPALRLDPGASDPALSVERNNVPALRQMVAAGGAYRAIKLNSSDVWELDAGAWIQGNTLIGGSGAPSPDSLLHLWQGSAGAVAAPGGTLLTLEASGQSVFVSFLTDNIRQGGIKVGDAQDNDAGQLYYDNNLASWVFYIESTYRLRYRAGFLDFQEATNVTTPASADLALAPGGELKLAVSSGIGNGASTNLTAPAQGTGGGPATMAVDTWLRIKKPDNTTGWLPVFV